MSKAFQYKKTSGGIKEYVLKRNNLKVLLVQNKATPAVGLMVTYEVGSRHEALGHTGSAHLLEHLMFKGTKTYNKTRGNHYDNVMENVGGLINATTFNDRTNYYGIVPSEHLELAMKPEADRMRNATFSEKDRQDEMPAVRSEFEIGENDPVMSLYKNVWATAYQAHPYHHDTIGWKDDIENVSIGQLRKFYDTFYWPNNATVTIVGDFDIERALLLIEKHFGKHKKSPISIPQTYTNEPKQEGVRHIEMNRAGNTNLVCVAHKVPRASHKDTHALQILTSVIGDGKQSRLYKALVEKGLATKIEIYNFPLFDPSLLQPFVFLTNGTSHSKVRDLIMDTYRSIMRKGITFTELKIAKAHVQTESAQSRDGIYQTLSTINEAIAMGDWTFYTNYQDKMDKVTASDVKRVANLYFIDSQMTTGYFKGV